MTRRKPFRTPRLALAALLLCGAAPLLAQNAVNAADTLSGYLRTLAGDPRNLTALLGAGRAALEIGDPNAAVGFYARATETAPRNGAAKAGLGAALVQLQQPQRALSLFNDALALNFPEADLAADRGLAFDLLGDSKHAQRDYVMALKARHDDETLRRYALSLGITGDRAQALSQIDPLIRRRDPAAWRARAFILALNGDVSGADSIAKAMLPSQAEALHPFLIELARLTPAQQAAAVTFGDMPSAASGTAVAYNARASAPPPMPAPTSVQPTPTVAARSDSRSRRGRARSTPVALPITTPASSGVARVAPSPPPVATIAARSTPLPTAVAASSSSGSFPVQSPPPPRPTTLAMATPRAMPPAFASTLPTAATASAPIAVSPAGAAAASRVQAIPTAPATRPSEIKAPAALVAPPVAGAAFGATPAASPAIGIAASPPAVGPAVSGTTSAPAASALAPSSVTASASPATALPTPAASGAAALARTDAVAGPGAVTPPSPVEPIVAAATGPAVAAASSGAMASIGSTPLPRLASAPPPASSAIEPEVPATIAQTAPEQAPPAPRPSAVAAIEPHKPIPVIGAPKPKVPDEHGRPTHRGGATSERGKPADAEKLASAVDAKATTSIGSRRAGTKTAATDTDEAGPTEPGRGPRTSRSKGEQIAQADTTAPEPATDTSARSGRKATKSDEGGAKTNRGRNGARDSETTAKKTDEAGSDVASDVATAGKGKYATAAADRKKSGSDESGAGQGSGAAKAKRDTTEDKKSDAKGSGRRNADSGSASRVYVQVAGGANKDDMDKAWASVKKKAPDLMKGKSPSTTPLRFTNRLLVGPFKDEDEAQGFVNKMAGKGLSGFVFKSDKGQKVEKVAGK